jgi:hypothetical protein
VSSDWLLLGEEDGKSGSSKPASGSAGFSFWWRGDSPFPLLSPGSVMDVAGGGVRMRVEWGFGSSRAFASSEL